MNAQDARLTAFCSTACPELFHAIVHRHEIFRHDPLDVPSVHEEARRAFASLLNRVGAGLPYGKILLLLGEAGSGKTHLMRAFRSEVTSTASGYFAYMQMTSSETNYAQYVLTNVIDSLHQPYDEAVSEISGLMRLSNGLVEDPDLFDPAALLYLRDGELDLPRVFDCSDHLIGKLGLQNLNPDLLRVLLLLQRSEPHLKNLVLQYLRCHDLSHHDQQKLGGIKPLRDASGPREVIKSLAGLAWALEKTPFVLCLDQLEDIYELNAPTQERFLAAMRVVREVADAVPSLIVAIACLEDFYQKLKTSLTSPLLDRIEKDPEPVRLSSLRSAAEVEQLIIRRLQFLFAECEAPFADEQPLFPFAADVPQKLAGFRARAVLELCRQARERSLASGHRPEIQDGQEPLVPPIVDLTVPLEQRWNDFYTGFKPAAPESETAMTELLAWALVESVRELPDGCTVTASAHEKQVYAETKAHGEFQSRLLVTICNEKPQGGSLGHAVDAARERAQNQNRRCIIARSTVFPDNPRTQIAKKLGELIAEGGRRTVIEDSDWRAMQA
ncbi:MAG: ATP-binding protein, partial [Gammaproteobacteria bacterium]